MKKRSIIRIIDATLGEFFYGISSVAFVSKYITDNIRLW
jgi:hypothetical protein